jgi:hypothetical protein
VGKRITVTIEDGVDKKIRTIQARQIKNTSSSVSYSQVINQILHKKIK